MSSTRSSLAAFISEPPAAKFTPPWIAGDKWKPIVRDLPAVLSVEAQTLPMIRVILPPNLRTLAHVDGEVRLKLNGTLTQRSLLGRG